MKTPFNVKDINFDNIKFIPSGNRKSIMLRYLKDNRQNTHYVNSSRIHRAKMDMRLDRSY